MYLVQRVISFLLCSCLFRARGYVSCGMKSQRVSLGLRFSVAAVRAAAGWTCARDFFNCSWPLIRQSLELRHEPLGMQALLHCTPQ